MPDVVKIDLGELTGPWPGFTVSGVTGADAGEVNGDWQLATDLHLTLRYYERIDGDNWKWVDLGNGTWELRNSGGVVSAAQGIGNWPWTAAWTPEVGTIGGTWAFAYLAIPPVSATIAGAVATVQATLTTALTGTNNDLLFTAVPPGRLGNAIILIYVNPGTNNAPLSVSVSARTITVNLATNGSAVITSTAAQVKTAIEASAAASALVTVANAPGNDGTGVVTAMSLQDLAGGEGGLPEPPVKIDL